MIRLYRDRAEEMCLVHYAEKPLGELELDRTQDTGMRRFFKPRGLWVSDDACEDNWRAWCQAEDFNLDALACAHDIELIPDANILLLGSSFEIDEFTREYRHNDPEFTVLNDSAMFIDWPRLAERYAGLIVTPYIWERRLSLGGGPTAMWYYSWDCASGCIWDLTTIASIRLRPDQDPPAP